MLNAKRRWMMAVSMNCFIMPALLMAAPITSPTPSSMSAPSAKLSNKDEWLKQVEKMAPDMLCRTFTGNIGMNKKMMAANIDYQKCVTLVPISFDKCKAQYYSEIPPTLTEQLSNQWASTLGECVGTDFVFNYISHTIPPTIAPD